MEDKIDDGGYVYPGPRVIHRQLKDCVREETKGHQEGATRRDLAAMMAMQSMCKSFKRNFWLRIFSKWTDAYVSPSEKSVAVRAYEYADALIAEGRKGE